MIALYIILAILCILIIPLFLNFHLILEYDGEPHMTLRVLFVRINLIRLSEKFLKRAKKPKKKKKKKKKTESKPEPKPEEKKKKPRDILDFLRFVKKLAENAAARLIKRLRIKLCYLDITVGSSEADKTAILYGAVCTAVSSLDEILRQFTRYSCNREKISIKSDFLAQSITAKAKIIFTIKPIFVITTAIGVIMNLFKNKSKKTPTENGKELKNERSTAQTNH